MGAKIKDMTGKRFGKLVVTRLASMKTTSQGLRVAMWECDCDCGTVGRVVGGVELRGGKTKSCGCLKLAALEKGRAPECKRGTTHGMSGSITYGCWANMVARCSRESSPSFKGYGGLGIKVCERWRMFENFFEDMGPRPSKKHSLDRWPNNKGDYEPGNVRWATNTEQGRNKKSNKLLRFNGEEACVSEWAEKTGIKVGALAHRINRGWSVSDALTRPVKKKRAHSQCEPA